MLKRLLFICILVSTQITLAEDCNPEYEKFGDGGPSITDEIKTQIISEIQNLDNKISLTKEMATYFRDAFGLIEHSKTRVEIIEEMKRLNEYTELLKREIKVLRKLANLKEDKTNLQPKYSCQYQRILEFEKEQIVIMKKRASCKEMTQFEDTSIVCASKATRNQIPDEKIQACSQASSIENSFFNCLDLSKHLNIKQIQDCSDEKSTQEYLVCLQKGVL